MLQTFGNDLFGESVGHTPSTVLALPGWMRQRSDFRNVLGGLDAVALDLPGFGGASPEPASGGGAARYAELVTPALMACAMPTVVVGHSFGGRVAVHLAARYPERIAALVLTGVPLLRRDDRPPPKVSLAHRVARWANRVSIVSDERMEARRRRHGSEDYRNASGVMRQVLVSVVQETYEEQLRVIAAAGIAVWMVWGADDDAVPVSTATRAAQILGPSTHVDIIAGAGHLLPLQRPEALRAAIDAALAASGAGSGAGAGNGLS